MVLPPVPRPTDPPPPPPPPGFQAKVDAMSLHDLDYHMQQLMPLVKQVRSNPPVGHDIEIAELEGAFAVLVQAAADMRAKQVPPPPIGNVALAQGVTQIQGIITGTVT